MGVVNNYEETNQLLRAIMEQKISARSRSQAIMGVAKGIGPHFVIEALVEIAGEWQEAYWKRFGTSHEQTVTRPGGDGAHPDHIQDQALTRL